LFDSGYESNLFTSKEKDGFAALIYPLQTITNKIAATTYCGLPFFQDLRYLDLSQRKTMYLNAVGITQKFDLQL